jgi:hypothetical protein
MYKEEKKEEKIYQKWLKNKISTCKIETESTIDLTRLN